MDKFSPRHPSAVADQIYSHPLRTLRHVCNRKQICVLRVFTNADSFTGNISKMAGIVSNTPIRLRASVVSGLVRNGELILRCCGGLTELQELLHP
jgi:hypothetical protein